MPRRFEEEGKFLKLQRSLYGLSQSPRHFFEHLTENLIKVGLKQSEVEPCLFISKKVIFLVYVDYTLYFIPNVSDIDMVLEKLRELNVEDDVAGFLGVLIKKLDEGRIEMTQTVLIKRILEVMGIEVANPKSTPAETEAIPDDKTGNLTEPHFNYARIIGTLHIY